MWLFDGRKRSFLRKFCVMSWTAADLPDLSGRFAIITGGNSGVGWQAAKALAEHGARVLLACRDLDRASAAAQRIRAAHPKAEVEVGPPRPVVDGFGARVR